jgi:uncharacterized membrane protein
MSFTKKISAFLKEAEEKNIIDAASSENLQEFAKNYSGKSAVNVFTNSIGFSGGFTVLLGLILLISHNWSQISDLVKIFSYVASLAGFYFFASLLQKKNPKISNILYFIAAGYVLAGIGLIAQIYHLSSNSGEAFLIWFIMILPLAFLLRHKWIGVMAIFAFYSWLSMNAFANGNLQNLKTVTAHFTTMAISLIMIPRFVRSFNDCFDHVKFFGLALLSIIVMAMGFDHKIIMAEFNGELSLHPVIIAVFIFNFLALCYGILFGDRIKDAELFHSKFSSWVLMVTNVLPFVMTRNYEMMVSITYWIIWFALGGIMIYQGAKRNSRILVNYGTRYVMLGILARFFDVVGSMLFTGSMFMLLGSLLILIAYLGEKYRKYLISKFS